MQMNPVNFRKYKAVWIQRKIKLLNFQECLVEQRNILCGSNIYHLTEHLLSIFLNNFKVLFAIKCHTDLNPFIRCKKMCYFFLPKLIKMNYLQMICKWCTAKIFLGTKFCLFITSWKVYILGVFLIHTFLHLDWIRRDTLSFSVFSPNARKYEQLKLRVRTLFTQCRLLLF